VSFGEGDKLAPGGDGVFFGVSGADELGETKAAFEEVVANGRDETAGVKAGAMGRETVFERGGREERDCEVVELERGGVSGLFGRRGVDEDTAGSFRERFVAGGSGTGGGRVSAEKAGRWVAKRGEEKLVDVASGGGEGGQGEREAENGGEQATHGGGVNVTRGRGGASLDENSRGRSGADGVGCGR